MFIMGKSQTGKTRTAKIITKVLITSERPVIVFDPNCRWTEKRESEIAFSPENVIHNVADIHAKGLCIFQPNIDANSGQIEEWTEVHFEAFCKKVRSLFHVGNFVVMIDELHNFITTFSANKDFQIFVKNCHNFDVGYIAIMQRMQEGIKAPFANADHLIVFRLKYAGDLKMMKLTLGDVAERLFSISDTRIEKHNALYQNPDGDVTEFGG
jgi:hypothetical protein